jgi:acetaldehyde dehydrogenase (acetylating)
MNKSRANVAILGTGKIGIDLLFKIQRSEHLNCVLVAGRNAASSGLDIAQNQCVTVSDQGIDSILNRVDDIDIVFDATSALAHVRHWDKLKDTHIRMIDLTPSKLGAALIPAVNLNEALHHRHVNMISCGGQSSIPIVHAISSVVPEISYVEVVSSIASKSAGAATRLNLDEYINTTELGIQRFSSARKSKVILILNPAEPPVNMQTTISIEIKDAPMDAVIEATRQRVAAIQRYVLGYELIFEPKQIDANRLVTMIKVIGRGDYLPKYAGNLDIINCAAVAAAEKMAEAKLKSGLTQEVKLI